MEEVGRALREARERLGYTLEEVERATRIRARHLEALEAGDLDRLPSPVHARGFLRNYADFLGLDSDALLLRFAEHLQARGRAAAIERDTRPSVTVRRRRPAWLSVDLLVAAVVVAAVLAVVVWGAGRVAAGLRERAAEVEARSAFLVATLAPTGTPSAANPSQTPQPAEALPTQAADSSPAPAATPLVLAGEGDLVEVRLLVEKRAWVSVRVDGEEGFRGRLPPGAVVEAQAAAIVEVWTGNAGGVRVIYNGFDQGLLGDVGEVAIRLWTVSGMVTPTATVTPTPTATPPVAPTPTATP